MNEVVLFILYLIQFRLVSCTVFITTTIGGIETAPLFAENDDVQFYYLETSFPYNCPSNIKYVL